MRSRSLHDESITFRCPKHLLQRLESLAARQGGRSTSSLIREILEGAVIRETGLRPVDKVRSGETKGSAG